MAYTMRHSCASWLVSEGLPTRLVADFLGTSEKMIIDHYGHLAPDYQEEAALAIGRSLKKRRFGGSKMESDQVQKVFDFIGGPGSSHITA
jgi:hypothetical protein